MQSDILNLLRELMGIATDADAALGDALGNGGEFSREGRRRAGALRQRITKAMIHYSQAESEIEHLRTLTNDAPVERLVEKVKTLIGAWESLPGGNHRPATVEAWLSGSIAPAVDGLRAALTTAPSARIEINGEPATVEDVVATARQMEAEDGGYPASTAHVPDVIGVDPLEGEGDGGPHEARLMSQRQPASTDTADRREALRRMSDAARDLNVASALDLLATYADDETLASLIAGPGEQP